MQSAPATERRRLRLESMICEDVVAVGVDQGPNVGRWWAWAPPAGG